VGAVADIVTRLPDVRFRVRDAVTPSVIYIGPGDDLRVQMWASQVATPGVQGRLLRAADGLIVPFAFNLPTVADRVRTDSIFKLAEGFLLGLRCNAPVGTVRGQVYVRVQLSIGSVAAGAVLHNLCAGYVSDSDHLGWPDATNEPSFSGRGNLRSITGTDPAAGAEISETVPTGAVWRLMALSCQLTTSGVGSSRTARLALDDGTNIYYQVEPSATTPISVTRRFSSGAIGDRPASVTTDFYWPIPYNVFMPAAHRLRTVTNNLDATDNYTAPQMLVEEWLQP